MRKPLISGNWKMNNNHFEAIQSVQKLAYLVGKDDFEQVDVSIHPPFTDIRSVQTVIDADKLEFSLGAQHCHWEDKGAFTGEVSPVFLSKLGVEYVICGHSERRELFGETDEMVNSKVAAILKHGMTPIMCVGETLAEREAGETETKVLGQVRAGLAGRSADQIGSLVIAYEPIWAIDPRSDRRDRRRRRGGEGAHPVRRVGEGGNDCRTDGWARRGRCAGGRGEPRPRRVRTNLQARRLTLPRHRSSSGGR